MTTNTYTLPVSSNPKLNYIIPGIAPYVLPTITSISIVATAKSWCSATIGVTTPLVMGLDWVPSLRFDSATAELGYPVYFAISFLDTALTGTLTVTTTSIAGTVVTSGYTPSNAQITAFAASLVDPLATTWETAFPLTVTYPSTTLSYAATNASYISSLLTKLNSLNSTIATSTGAASVFNFNNHINSSNNPHITTPKTLGLDAVPNWTTATVTDMVNKNPTAFVTPVVVTAGLASVIVQATPTVPGFYKLNIGTSGGDDTNTVKALTAAGLLALITSGTANAVNAYFNKNRHAVRFSPYPIVYPARWNSVYYNTFVDLVAAVRAYTNMPYLMNSDPMGTIWFPNSVIPPSLLLG